PPPAPERVVGLGDEARAEPVVARADLELVQPLEVEGQRALRAVDLPAERVLPARGEPCRLDRADRAVLEPDGGLERVVDLPAGLERRGERRDGVDLADEVAREVD